MLRIFDEHVHRAAVSLDGLWRLKIPGEEQDRQVLVPGVWETIPDLADWKGRALMERTVSVDRAGPVLLRFGGVSHTADVLWDGEPVGHHYNAFTGFEVLLDEVLPGEHALQVWVDNSFSPASALHVPNDYMTYGGISRSVEMDFLKAWRIVSETFHAEETGPDSFLAHVRVTVQGFRDARGLSLDVGIGTDALSDPMARTSLPLDLKAGETKTVQLELPVSGITRWDVLKPKLYTLHAVLRDDGGIADDLIDRVGFRTVEVRDGQILLNHRPVQIRGFNRHEEYGDFGCSVPPAAMMQDLQLLLDMGGNSIRTCHYPNDPRFLDLCDALGILVWEEHHARALSGDILRSETFAGQIHDCNTEMIAQHVNHPCIYVWGVLNECESETAFGRELYARNLGELRELDPTRPVTYATCRVFTDVCLDLADIVSWNIYPHWYEKKDPQTYLQELIAWSDANGGAGKPVLISEIGAGGIPGWHDPFRRAKWSEERQADILREQLTAVMNHPRVNGVYVWQLADVKVDESWFQVRPRTMNNKGVVDLYRRPKLSYGAVRDMYRKMEGKDL